MTYAELGGFTYRFEPGDPGTRTLLVLHGTGGDENDLLPLGRMLYPGANLLSPRGQVLENGAPRFFRRFAEGQLDVDDLKTRTHDLVSFVGAAATEDGFDASLVIALGYSNGANIAVSTLLLHPDVLHAAVLLRPMFVYDPEEMPTLDGVGIFIASGRNDPLIDPTDVERLAELLKTAGAEVTLTWSPGGHPLQRDEMAQAATWLAQRGP